MIIASKGAAGVTGAGLATLAGGLGLAPAGPARRRRPDRRHRPVHVRGARADELRRQLGGHGADRHLDRQLDKARSTGCWPATTRSTSRRWSTTTATPTHGRRPGPGARAQRSTPRPHPAGSAGPASCASQAPRARCRRDHQRRPKRGPRREPSSTEVGDRPARGEAEAAPGQGERLSRPPVVSSSRPSPAAGSKNRDVQPTSDSESELSGAPMTLRVDVVLHECEDRQAGAAVVVDRVSRRTSAADLVECRWVRVEGVDITSPGRRRLSERRRRCATLAWAIPCPRRGAIRRLSGSRSRLVGERDHSLRGRGTTRSAVEQFRRSGGFEGVTSQAAGVAGGVVGVDTQTPSGWSGRARADRPPQQQIRLVAPQNIS